MLQAHVVTGLVFSLFCAEIQIIFGTVLWTCRPKFDYQPGAADKAD